jgi:dTMP kinase
VNGGRLISLDGIDGAGKSTQLPRLVAWLEARGHRVCATREPTDGPYGRRIRAAARSNDAPTASEELAWFMADRAEHVAAVIEPALARGEVVVSDRYFLSTVAYQGARGILVDDILTRSEQSFPVPDLALLLEIDATRGLARAAERGDAAEPLFEEASFLTRVADIFARIERPYIVRIDAARDADRVTADLLHAVEQRLGL